MKARSTPRRSQEGPDVIGQIISTRPTVVDEATDERRVRLACALARTGDEDREAFHEVYLLTSAKLFGICLRICGERQAAEDVLHEVYLKVWRCAAAWEPARGSAITWLTTIARNRAIDWRRVERVRKARPLDDATVVTDPSSCAETMLLSDERARNLQRVLGALDPCVRDAIGAAFFDGLTYAELAKRNNVPLGTMKSWMRRGLARMKDGLDHLEGSSEQLLMPCSSRRLITDPLHELSST